MAFKPFTKKAKAGAKAPAKSKAKGKAKQLPPWLMKKKAKKK